MHVLHVAVVLATALATPSHNAQPLLWLIHANACMCLAMTWQYITGTCTICSLYNVQGAIHIMLCVCLWCV